MVSVTGLLASTSANWGSAENMDPLATADRANAEAIPTPIPANMDLFISLPLMCNLSFAPIVGFLPSPLKGRARQLRQRLTTGKVALSKCCQ
ncbi:hypothetical protein D3C85_1672580 [compost metagenome]